MELERQETPSDTNTKTGFFAKRTTRDWLVGSFDYAFLCTPKWPYCGQTKRAAPHFFGRDDWLGILTAMVVGLQHCLAMVGGLIVPPLLIVPFGTPNAADIQRYLIQAALIVTGFMSICQVTGIPVLGRNRNCLWGAGVLSVMGVSFTTVPIAQSVINTKIAGGSTFEEAYGALLGTLLLTTLTPLLVSFLPIKALKKVFPPVVTGVTIMLIGISLTGSGLQNWGGGAYCAENYETIQCTGNGDVILYYGSPQYVGLGFLVFVVIILLEIFGSPFMRNCSAICGLLVGYFVSALCTVDGNRYVTNQYFESAPAITFLWTTTFPISFYAPAIIPLIIVALITSVESVGDTTATMEASRMPTNTPEAAMRIKGALFNDGVSGFFSALATSLPLTTFAQNNGVITLTNVAARQAGWACAGWLILLGILGKVGAFIISIPNCVLGGMTTFLFANVISSGIKIIISEGNLDRRQRFILACSMALGVGVQLVPQWANGYLWPVTDGMSAGMVGLRDAVILVLSTSFCLGAVVAFILNLIMPHEASDSGLAEYEQSRKQSGMLGRTMTESDPSYPSGKGLQTFPSDDGTGKAGAAPYPQLMTATPPPPTKE